MTGYNNINAYKKAFASVDKVNQVIMLYDTAIASMQQARQAILDKNIEERFNKISKAFQIITGLRDSLDMSNGGDVAAVLSQWYSGTGMRILAVNRTQDLELCDLCIKHIKQMRSAWADVETQVKASSGTEPSATSGDKVTTSATSSAGSMEASSGSDFFEAISKAAISGEGMNFAV
jgi:flagellar secretion chaperone FliS